MNRKNKIELLRQIAAGKKSPDSARFKIMLYDAGKLQLLDRAGNIISDINPAKLPRISSPADYLLTIHESEQPDFKFEAQNIVCDSIETAKEFAMLINETISRVD